MGLHSLCWTVPPCPGALSPWSCAVFCCFQCCPCRVAYCLPTATWDLVLTELFTGSIGPKAWSCPTVSPWLRRWGPSDGSSCRVQKVLLHFGGLLGALVWIACNDVCLKSAMQFMVKLVFAIVFPNAVGCALLSESIFPSCQYSAQIFFRSSVEQQQSLPTRMYFY